MVQPRLISAKSLFFCKLTFLSFRELSSHRVRDRVKGQQRHKHRSKAGLAETLTAVEQGDMGIGDHGSIHYVSGHRGTVSVSQLDVSVCSFVSDLSFDLNFRPRELLVSDHLSRS
jgi:hypothetical protein